MSTRLKKILIITVGLIGFLFLSVLVFNYVIENKLKNRIENISENVKIQYKAVDVNLLKGSINLVDPQIFVYGKTTQKINAQIKLNYFLVDGFNYWDYFFNNNISIKNIIFNQPNFTYYYNNLVKRESYQNIFKNNLNKIIQIKSIEIHDGNVDVYSISNDSLLLKSEKLNFKINRIEIDQSIESNPIAYKDFNVTSSNVFYKINTYDNLFLEYLDVSSKYSKLKGMTIQTKYSKEDLSNQISFERDHYDLAIDSIEIKNQDFGFKEDSLFYFKSHRIDFHRPVFKIYRDKLVADDLIFKPLYSKMLRDLNFNLTLYNLFINNASITYIEKVKANTQGGKLLFSKLDAEIKNLSNTYKLNNAVTSANIKAVFMKNTPINLQWDFDVNNTNDDFIFKSEIGKLKANSMNQFMEPNLNVMLEGEITKTYFTINGNDHSSQIDLKLHYDDFDVIVLKENGNEKNKLLSSLVNLFVSKDSNKSSGNFRHGSKINIERSTNKSVFNYLWLNIKEGLLNAMTGDGKKEQN